MAEWRWQSGEIAKWGCGSLGRWHSGQMIEFVHSPCHSGEGIVIG